MTNPSTRTICEEISVVMDQQDLQHNSRCRSTHHPNTYPNVQPQATGSGYGVYPTPTSHQEWLHLMSIGSLYQPLFYAENTHDSTSQYWTGHPVETGRSQALASPPQGVPTVPTAPAVAAPVASPVPSSVPSASARTPNWDAWSPPREESRSPAEDREEEAWEPEDLRRMGYLDSSGSWRCRYEGCRSTRVFVRACDLRKHFRGHDKYFFCTERPCAIAGVGFSTKKDYQRHMGSHQPTIKCPHPDCGRIFSRKDNMREHFRKIHMCLRNNLFPRPCRRSRRASEDKRSPPASNATKCSSREATKPGADLHQNIGTTRQQT
ncbi:uncharacterized protein LY79DRAFT_554965 [Colletotrichum navitas]|uniref:C2H2-type domain-containing protein n=1 Tax=Colletotrichum navitas TaxID=681940 RepID=A0AAD8V2Z0_9PEZI|nr:uncharacterized protein LY79DRAFT_554965 [Colletotrichum navitas]KAK1590310.1 hypothetical protein LY79DRAFT_554965 [Colletotrichum navitas]